MSKKEKKSASTHKKDQIVATSVTEVAPAKPSQIPLTPEEAAKVRTAEQAILQSKMQLADLELHLSEVNTQKTNLLNQTRANNQAMIDTVRAIAINNGIDPDGVKDDSKWNLDTTTMVFNRVK